MCVCMCASESHKRSQAGRRLSSHGQSIPASTNPACDGRYGPLHKVGGITLFLNVHLRQRHLLAQAATCTVGGAGARIEISMDQTAPPVDRHCFSCFAMRFTRPVYPDQIRVDGKFKIASTHDIKRSAGVRFRSLVAKTKIRKWMHFVQLAPGV